MADQKQGAQAPDEQETPVETEESGAGYGNNAGQQGVGSDDTEDET